MSTADRYKNTPDLKKKKKKIIIACIVSWEFNENVKKTRCLKMLKKVEISSSIHPFIWMAPQVNGVYFLAETRPPFSSVCVILLTYQPTNKWTHVNT